MDILNTDFYFVPFSVPGGAPKMSDDDSEYVVERIMTHMDFDEILSKAMQSKAKFNPASISRDKKRHSKYAYLVHWEGYGIPERTWEPEANLKNCVRLAEYKEAKGMPMEHERIERFYGPTVWRRLQVAADKVRGIRYLLTDEEIEKRNALKENSNKSRERPEADNEEVVEKKKKREEDDGSVGRPEKSVTPNSQKDPKEAEARKISKANRESTSKDYDNNNGSSHKEKHFSAISRPPGITSLPGIKSLDTNTPRIQKKTSSVISPIGGSGISNRREPSAEKMDSATTEDQTQLFKKPSTSSNPPIKLKLKKLPGGTYEQASPYKPMEKAKSENCLVSLGAMEVKKNKEMSLKTAINKATSELENISLKLKKFPKDVNVSPAVRGFPYALNLRKHRRYQSEGMLSDFFNRNADLEIFSLNEQKAVLVENGILPCINKKVPEEPFLARKGPVQRPMTEHEIYEELAKENVIKMKQAMHNFNFNKHFVRFLKSLVIAYSKDDSVRFRTMFLKGFPDQEEFDIFRFAAIVLIISKCNHRQWKADEKQLKIVEADGNVTWGNVRQQEILCSRNHRKCSWMRLFFELIPKKYRFLETTGKFLTGTRNDDGPFRDDVFFRCMRYGAECQKNLFFEFNKPIGIQEDPEGDFMCDAMHMLAVQYGNLQRVASYISNGGLDINALAYNTVNKQVYRLQDYLADWVERNVQNNVVTDQHRRYYRRLQDLVRFTAQKLDAFMSAQLNQVLYTRLRGRWTTHMQLTYPHILRCAPENNESNDGDGNQVLTCLFYPSGVSFRDGLDSIVKKADEPDMERLRSRLQKFRKMVSDGKARLIVALYRVDVKYSAHVQKVYDIPEFELVRSDEDYSISKMSLLRQIDLGDPELVDIELIEHKPLSSPGCRYFAVEKLEHEKKLIVPGTAHIEIRGEFDRPMSFITQVFLIKKAA